MFKIFKEPRLVVSKREAAMLYPDKAYIMLNIVDMKRGEVYCGYTGELYCIADNNPDDLLKYHRAMGGVEGLGSPVGIFESFRLEDTITY